MGKQNDWVIPLKVCRESIRKWSGDARVLAIIFLVCLFAWVRIKDLRGMCIANELSISCWYFAFQMAGIHALFYYFGLLLLFCDAPFIDKQQMDVILRTGKKNWFIGKILYIIVASCLYFLLIYVVGVLEFVPYVGFSTEWEDMINILSMDDLYGSIINRSIVMTYTPIEACLTQYVVCVLFAIFLGLLIFYSNLFKSKVIGIGIALTMVLTGVLVNMVNLVVARIAVYFIPMVWTNIEVFKRTAEGVPFVYAIAMLSIGIVVLIILIMQKSKSYSIECQEEM